ncbi:MAG: hypothetical protein E6J45_05650 [Chloroflexi bacterium]|nr:MAG: hypothetical protein E6J45_05650 [Chloroflexota bacterium]
MIDAPPPVEHPDPLASPRLLRRFPNLREAMDPGIMRERLQAGLFDSGGAVVEACERPRAELSGPSCALQYPLHLGAPGGTPRTPLALATMFTSRAAAAEWESAVLCPLAERMRGPAPSGRLTGVIDDLCLAVSVFPVSGALPSLVRAFDAAHMGAVLRAVVPDATILGIELVVFRRTRGCVLRYRLRSESHAVVYGKVGYSATAAVAVSAALKELAARKPADAHDPIRFPRVIGHVPELVLTLVDEMPGTRAALDAEAQVTMLVDAAARVAARVHASRVAAGDPRTAADEIQRACASVELVRPYAPKLAEWLTHWTDSLRAAAASTRPESVVLSHGDLTPSQLLFDGDGVTVLDFDKMCRAEPALDLGRFVAYLGFHLAKRSHGGADVFAERFVERYRAAGGPAVHAQRVALYEVATLVRMAARSWLQLKPERLRFVSEVLAARNGASHP